MICLEKAITPEEWIDFVEGLASAQTRSRVESHLLACPACRDLHSRLLHTRATLQSAAQAEALPEKPVARLWDNVCFRIRRFMGQQDRPAQPAPEFAIDIQQLRSILVSMCGEAAAEGALHTASVRSGSQLDAHFARNLGSIVELMCGSRAARFVEHAAQSSPRNKVA
jgi:anti-sigma factor RsiW